MHTQTSDAGVPGTQPELALPARFLTAAGIFWTAQGLLSAANTLGKMCIRDRGYANQVALGAFSLAQSPARALNVTGPETVSVREAACQLGQYFNKTPVFQDDPGDTALLSNAGACIDQFGYPQYGVHRLIRWQAQWILQGGRLLNKPTHFEENKGNF